MKYDSSYWRGGWGIALMEKTKVESQIAADVENRDSELWWKITLSPNGSFFPGWIRWLRSKFKKNEYTYEDSLDITTEGDVTTIRGKE